MEDELLGDILGEIKSSSSSGGKPKLSDSKRFVRKNFFKLFREVIEKCLFF